MIFAAIDIGSNAIRLQINRFIPNKKKQTKRLEYVRFPLRLGNDAFRLGEISYRSEEQFIKLMQAYKALIDLYNVDDFYGCATSAMRDSSNGDRVLERAYQSSGLHIRKIDGKEEAELMQMEITHHVKGNAMHIDVGGGSAEVAMYASGKVTANESFRLGSVRNMNQRHDPNEFGRMKAWIEEHLPKDGIEHALATGGNINKYLDYVNYSTKRMVPLEKLTATRAKIDKLSMEERMVEMDMREDRADVISHASEIYFSAFEWAGAKGVLIPKVGLKEGIMRKLVTRNQY